MFSCQILEVCWFEYDKRKSCKYIMLKNHEKLRFHKQFSTRKKMNAILCFHNMFCWVDFIGHALHTFFIDSLSDELELIWIFDLHWFVDRERGNRRRSRERSRSKSKRSRTPEARERRRRSRSRSPTKKQRSRRRKCSLYWDVPPPGVLYKRIYHFDKNLAFELVNNWWINFRFWAHNSVSI